MEPFKRHHLHYRADHHAAIIGISTRHNGVSPYPDQSLNLAHYIDDTNENVVENQRRLADAIGMPRENWVFPIQIHSNQVKEVTARDKGSNIDSIDQSLTGYDGLFTKEKGLLLTMCFADCVPIYITSLKDDFVGLAHAGWRGTKGMVSHEIIKHYASPELLQCYIGPSITKAEYTVNLDIKNQFELPFDTDHFFEQVGEDSYMIDLQGLNKEILLYSGVKEENIFISQHCTATNDDFFSYRTEKGQTGRMLAFIGMREA